MALRPLVHQCHKDYPVQELLGHAAIALTLDTYSHVAPALHARVAEEMEALFDTSTQPPSQVVRILTASMSPAQERRPS